MLVRTAVGYLGAIGRPTAAARPELDGMLRATHRTVDTTAPWAIRDDEELVRAARASTESFAAV